MARLTPADEVAAEAQREGFEAAFADYLTGPFRVPTDGWPALLAGAGVDLARSRLVLDGDGAVQAFAYCAPRASLGRWRLASMGARPAARGSGAAQALLADFIARGRSAGLQGLELECFAQNPRALALYARHGFEARHALHGFAQQDWRPAAPGAAAPLPVAREDALGWLRAQEQALGTLPLQFGPTTVAARSGWQAWRLGGAQGVLQRPGERTALLISVLDASDTQQDLEALLLGLAAQTPGLDWQVHELLREDLGGAALRRLGFSPSPRHQLWMLRSF